VLRWWLPNDELYEELKSLTHAPSPLTLSPRLSGTAENWTVLGFDQNIWYRDMRASMSLKSFTIGLDDVTSDQLMHLVIALDG